MSARHNGTLIAALTLALAGCATGTLERDAAFVDSFARQQWSASAKLQGTAEDRDRARTRTGQLLLRPLSAGDAVLLALDNSPAFQAMLADGVRASASATQSARLANPVFTFERLQRREDGAIDLDIGRMLSVSLLELIYLPARLDAAESARQQARLNAAAGAVDVATNARQAWVRAVAAEQSVKYFEQVMNAADASAELAKRMYQAGNFSKLQRARQQAFYADAVTQLARARQTATAARETLVRALGLNSAQAAALKLPERLPDLPQQAKDEPAIAQSAMTQRLDVQIAKSELDALGRKNGFNTASSFVNAFHIAGVRNSETGKTAQRGYELELALPVFDFGDASRAANQAAYLASLNRAAQIAVDAESQVREQYAAYRTAHDIANHYRQEIIPLRKAIADETLLKYNGMLVGVFDLLAESRAQIGSVIQAIEAERDFWLADAALQATLLGKPTTGASMTARIEAPSSGAAH
jgi:outer membrane protein TolC